MVITSLHAKHEAWPFRLIHRVTVAVIRSWGTNWHKCLNSWIAYDTCKWQRRPLVPPIMKYHESSKNGSKRWLWTTDSDTTTYRTLCIVLNKATDGPVCRRGMLLRGGLMCTPQQMEGSHDTWQMCRPRRPPLLLCWVVMPSDSCHSELGIINEHDGNSQV